jgi:penicillin-binding protein 1A
MARKKKGKVPTKDPKTPGKAKAAAKRAQPATVPLVARILNAMVWVIIAAVVSLGAFALGLPGVDESALTRRPRIVLVDAAGGELLGIGDNYGAIVTIDDVPQHLINAVVAIEDRRFFSHAGIDPRGLARAALANARAGRVVQGGSTITQQVAKNLFLTPDRTIVRKIREMMLALWLDYRLSKPQIMTLYLNRVYLGAGTYGVAAASERYFKRRPSELTVYQSAVLAGLLKAPSRYNPAANADLTRARAKIVLATMVETGAITASEAATAERTAPAVLRRAATTSAVRARYFADWVLGQIESYVGPVDRDLVVQTTLDPALQSAAERALARQLDGEGSGLRIGQGAIVALDVSGAVLAMVGGRDYADSQFNRATQALRQPGSAFKPFVYLAGLKAGIGPDDVIVDEPIIIDGWRPQNFSGGFRGPVTIADAVADSINTVAVTVARRAGLKAVTAEARRFGLTGRMPNDYSSALGSGEVTLLDLVTSYAPFANGGAAVLAHGIVQITARDGAVLYRRSGSGLERIAAGAHVAAMNRMLADVIARGTGKEAAFGYPAAGKTGTSSDFRDAWFVGYSAEVVAGVWVGNDDGAGMKAVTGGGVPARIWREVMTAAHGSWPARDLPGVGPDADRQTLGRLLRTLIGE